MEVKVKEEKQIKLKEKAIVKPKEKEDKLEEILPIENKIDYTITYKVQIGEEIKEISYLLTFIETEGVLEISKQNKFGTRVLIGRFTDKNGTKITFEKMLENFVEMSTLSYEKFKETFENRKKKIK